VLDCPTLMAKQILVSHVKDIQLGKRTYHYLLSGLVNIDLIIDSLINLSKLISYKMNVKDIYFYKY
jgi:hypothetical protein